MLKVLTGLPGLTAQPQKMSSAAQQQECKFLEASLKKGRFLQGRVFIWHAKTFFVKVRVFSCYKGDALQIKGPLFGHVYEPLTIAKFFEGIWGQDLDQIPRVPKQPCLPYALIALQQN